VGRVLLRGERASQISTSCESEQQLRCCSCIAQSRSRLAVVRASRAWSAGRRTTLVVLWLCVVPKDKLLRERFRVSEEVLIILAGRPRRRGRASKEPCRLKQQAASAAGWLCDARRPTSNQVFSGAASSPAPSLHPRFLIKLLVLYGVDNHYPVKRVARTDGNARNDN
jgi:hypothetical protein